MSPVADMRGAQLLMWTIVLAAYPLPLASELVAT